MPKQLIFSLSPLKLTIAVFLFSAFFFLADIGENSIRYSDEATHVRVIQEMYHSGDYLNPRLDGELYFNKPPLKMWLTTIVLRYLGESNFSFRLIDGLSSAGIVAITALFGLSIFGSYFAALISAFVLLGSHGFFYGGRFNTATQDAFVVFFNTLSLWFFYSAIQKVLDKKNKLDSFSMIAFGLSLAFGVLTKSIVGLVPLIIILPVLLLKKQILKELIVNNLAALFASVFAFLLPVGIFYAQLLYRNHDAWSRVFGYDIKARLFTEGFHNPEKWWFYLERLFVNSEFCAEWLLVLAILFQLVNTLRKLDFNNFFLTSWVVVPLIIFSALQSRAFHYIGPGFPAFALIIAGLMNSALNVFKAESRSYGKLVRNLCLIVLFIGSTEIVFSFYKASIRLLNDKRKLPIELAVNDLKENSDLILNVGTLDFQQFLDGDAYQRWRQQFYLDSIAVNRENFDIIQQVKDLLSSQKLDLLFASYSSALEFLKNKSQFPELCAYAALWKPENKRQNVNPAPADPQAMVLLFGNCSKYNKLEYFNLITESFSLESPEIKNVYGLSGKQLVANRVFWRNSYSDLVLAISRNDVWQRLPTQLSFVAATEKKSGNFIPLTIKLFLNGNYMGSQQISGGKFRSYSFDLPANSWRNSENLLVLHLESADSQMNLSDARFLLSEIKVELLDSPK